MRVIWSPLALDRVSEVAEYIARDNPVAAEKWVSGLFEAAEKLAGLSGRGRRVPEVGRPEIREIFFGDYRIFYRTDANRILILTVRHLRRLLDKEELRFPGR